LALKGAPVSSTLNRRSARCAPAPKLAHICCVAASLLVAAPASAQADRPDVAHVAAYADLADLALAAPVVLSAHVHAVVRVGRKSAPDLAPGVRRYLVRADVDGALLAPGPVPARVEYLWDVDAAPRPDIDDKLVLLFLAPVPGRADQFRLVSPRAQIAATPALEERVRAILLQSRDPRLGHRVTGVARAFTTPGTVPGAETTQLFLKTADATPVSLVVTARPPEPKHYGVSFGDTIDPDAPPPAPDTLGWYYLACGLPPALPPEATVELEEGARATVRADYAFVLARLGPCARTPAEASSTPTDAQSG
jgi:hypothetical protein